MAGATDHASGLPVSRGVEADVDVVGEAVGPVVQRRAELPAQPGHPGPHGDRSLRVAEEVLREVFAFCVGSPRPVEADQPAARERLERAHSVRGQSQVRLRDALG
jgi:hypothetical protein